MLLADTKFLDACDHERIGFTRLTISRLAGLSYVVAYIKEEQKRCISCGFLAKHPEGYVGLPTPRYYEIEPLERREGSYSQIFTHKPDLGSRWQDVDTELICFVNEVDLMVGIRELPPLASHYSTVAEGLAGPEAVARAAAAIEKIAHDRNCPAWYPYKPGLSPKEHYDEMNMRLFEKSLDAEREMREKSYRRQDRYFVIVGLILGMFQIIAAIILSYHESFTDGIMRRFFGH